MWAPFLFLVVLMFAFNSFSHGTQDLYPTFLQKDHQFTPQTVGLIAVVANVGRCWVGFVLEPGRKKSAGGGRSSLPHCWRFPSFRCGRIRIPCPDAGAGRLSDAIYGAGGVGRDSGTLERAFAAGGAGNLSGIRLSTGEICSRREMVCFRPNWPSSATAESSRRFWPGPCWWSQRWSRS
jgi:hypothetical protein